MTPEKLIDITGLVITNRAKAILNELSTLHEILDKNKVSLLTGIPKDDDDMVTLGECILNAVDGIGSLVKDYDMIKKTWGVTTPSPALDDEK